MGEGTALVKVTAPREIEREIEQLRAQLDRSLAELDRRRHELTNLKVQMRKHPGVFIGTGGAALLLFGGIGFAIWRSSRREQLPQRAKRLGRAAKKTLVRGERPAWEKILAAVGTTLAVGLTRKLIERAWAAPPKLAA